MFNILSVKEYLKVIRTNLENTENQLVESFKNLKNLKFPEDAKVLVAVSSMDDMNDEDFGVYLAVNQDMFDGVNQVNEYSDGVYLVDSFRLYKKFDTGDQFEKFVGFFDDNDLEEITMKEVSNWVKKCFDEAQIVLPLPIYFRFTDEENALNLVTGEWEDQMDIEL